MTYLTPVWQGLFLDRTAFYPHNSLIIVNRKGSLSGRDRPG